MQLGQPEPAWADFSRTTPLRAIGSLVGRQRRHRTQRKPAKSGKQWRDAMADSIKVEVGETSNEVENGGGAGQSQANE